MKKAFLFFILALCSIALFAQNVDWLWAKQAVGTDYDICRGIAVDANGNSYVTGHFDGSATFGTTTLTSSGSYDIFVAKMDINGNWLWAKQAGGTNEDEGICIAINANGNSYITGFFYGSATFGTTTLTSSGDFDIFVAKLNSNGNWLWAKQAGGTDNDFGNGIAVDANGNSYITGDFVESATFGTTTLTSSEYDDIFVAKLDINGNWLWVKQAGGTYPDYFYGNYGIAIDANGNSYVTGNFAESATFGTTTLTSSGDYDIFVAKMDINGNWLWAKQAGGTSDDYCSSITVDDNGNSYVTGGFIDIATFGTTTLTSNGDIDIFVAKMDSNGNWLWAMQAGGTNFVVGNSIAVDDNGNSYVTGYFWGSATFGTTTMTSSGNSDIFVAKLDSNGNWLWVKQAGGTSFDCGNSIAVDANGNSYVTGYFTESATFGATTLTGSGYKDIFVAKLGEVNSIDLPDIISFSGIRSIYPNPFNPLTTIDYEISMPADVKIEVYNNRGQLVRNFILGYKEQGSYKLTWEGEDNNGCLCSTGIYYIRMQAGKKIYIKKAVLLK
ncbi:MAG: SBBP repeat-containing protein [Candidatus Cloacimonas sp.]|nr:SBBP repeat-containing protein [Candidatus Cloacimonas sp.]